MVKFRRVYAHVQTHQSLHCLHTQNIEVDECANQNFRPLASLDMSTWVFIRGTCAYGINIKILCACPYLSEQLHEQLPSMQRANFIGSPGVDFHTDLGLCWGHRHVIMLVIFFCSSNMIVCIWVQFAPVISICQN